MITDCWVRVTTQIYYIHSPILKLVNHLIPSLKKENHLIPTTWWYIFFIWKYACFLVFLIINANILDVGIKLLPSLPLNFWTLLPNHPSIIYIPFVGSSCWKTLNSHIEQTMTCKVFTNIEGVESNRLNFLDIKRKSLCLKKFWFQIRCHS